MCQGDIAGKIGADKKKSNDSSSVFEITVDKEPAFTDEHIKKM
jgi:hypothetical protein